MVRVKICGITRLEDALAAVNFGVDALGFVFATSPRQVAPETVQAIVSQLPPFVTTVGVFVNEKVSRIEELRSFCRFDLVQLHGDETEEMAAQLGPRVIKAVRVRSDAPADVQRYGKATLLLDAYSPGAAGGAGKTFDWGVAVAVAKKRPIVLAGGLTPENVAQAIETVRPYGVDVSSGVEIGPGRKGHAKIEHFIRAAKTVARSS
ncbi:MAG: phosphoribosylanthranilate isomerase [Deltaproteobacteria bacterium]|nr:phosphoribosylanthranilate isomerase [Deltaproteobacteria bacterium]